MELFVFCRDAEAIKLYNKANGVKAYRIEDKADLLDVVTVSFCLDTAQEESESWAFAAAAAWLGLDYNYENEEVQERRQAMLAYWTEQGYEIDEAEWEEYWLLYWAIAGVDSGYGVDSWDSYWDLYRTCYIEQIVVEVL